ncbi:hypothetical protein RF11_11836 [Thelohanellus kitauei]|uniref:Tc1-like transposase DDE domain-containing protein n=1 Tax=Thelohanellus kitauei TaxID=669202 RepID=A0A0C2IXX0_THEKT|nr:hypothetical protein RF11_11836 [Thelohanellus kitauei]
MPSNSLEMVKEKQLLLEKNQADSRKKEITLKLKKKEGRRSMIGTTAHPIVPIPCGQNVTMLLAINYYNIIQCDAVFGCGVNAETFSCFLRRLVAVLGEGDFTIVMENVRFHHITVNRVLFEHLKIIGGRIFWNPMVLSTVGIKRESIDHIGDAPLVIRNVLSNQHSHAPDISRLEARKAINTIKESARSNKLTPREIISRETANLSEALIGS